MPWTIVGQLDTSSNDLSRFGQCRIEAFFEIVSQPAAADPSSGAGSALPPRGSPPPVDARSESEATRLVTRADDAGIFSLTFPDRERISSDTIRFVVAAPSGETIGDTRLRVQDMTESVVIRVRAPQAIVLPDVPRDTPPLARDTARQVRISGRVVERNGHTLPSSMQLILFGVDIAAPPSPEAVARALLATRTDASGYFSGEVPNQEFARAFVNVSGVEGEVKIALEDARIPQQMVLVVSLPHSSARPSRRNCDCQHNAVPPRTPTQTDIANAPGIYSADLGTGRCIEFNVPNRAIEEFDFYTVVRTTEPDIRGLSGDLSAGPSAPGGVNIIRAAATSSDETGTKREIADARLMKLSSLRFGARKPPGRTRLDAQHSVDWDSTPTFYEAASISHGHLLHFKQVWYADGYSLGDLLYSLPLAPGQKKLVSILDWERREQTGRDEATFATENLVASLSRDRDLSEVVTGALSESARGGSSSTTWGLGGGGGAAANGTYEGINFGALLGVSGGYGEADSQAWQDSARNLSADSLQRLRDVTLQSASAVRGLRSTVVHTTNQGEAVRATTEVVANNNHCHALTIQYFEVLRHLKVTHELAGVQECLFVPFPMSWFDRDKALRWRQSLQLYIQRRDLRPAFDSVRRVETNWNEVSFPKRRYADELVSAIIGELRLTVIIPLPPFPERPVPRPEDTLADTAAAMAEAVMPTTGAIGAILAVATGGLTLVAGAATDAAIRATQAANQGARALAESLWAEPSNEERYRRFQRDVVPGAVAGFVNTLELFAVVNANEVKLSGVDFTLVSEYEPGIPLLVTVRGTMSVPVTRSDIGQLIIKSAQGLPDGCRAIINSATIRYQTNTFEHRLIDDERINDDIDPPRIVVTFAQDKTPIYTKTTSGTGAALYSPLDAWEQRNPRVEDIRLAAELLEHLNDNLEYYHHAIWWSMDPNRRFMLLDGILAPGSDSRSVASVVENRPIGIVGNSMVLPVASGNRLDPRFRTPSLDQPSNLIDHYRPTVGIAAARISLPTRGVFAEAILGSCNACEKIDDSRYWRWEESPIQEPPAIEPLSTATRRTVPDSAQPTAFPTPLVAIQNAPPLSEPAGVRAPLETLGRQAFADITGLAGTQQNAAAAYSRALDTALQFGREASTLAQQAALLRGLDKTMNTIDTAEAEGKIDADKARELRTSMLTRIAGDRQGSPTDAVEVQKRLDVIAGAARSGAIESSDAQAISRDVVESLVDAEVAGRAHQAAATSVIKRADAGALRRAVFDPAGGAQLEFANYGASDPRSRRPVVISRGPVAIEQAASLLTRAVPMEFQSSFGLVRMVPGSIWSDRRMLVTVDSMTTRYLQDDVLFSISTSEFLRENLFDAAAQGVLSAKLIIELAKSEVTFLQGLLVPFTALLGATAVNVTLKYYANRELYHRVFAALDELFSLLNDLRKSHPKLFRSLVQTAAVDGFLNIPESFTQQDVAFFAGRVLRLILGQAAAGAQIGLVVVGRAIARISLILGSLQYPAGAAQALREEAERKALDLETALQEEGVTVDRKALEELIIEGANNPSSRDALNDIAQRIDEVMPLLEELAGALRANQSRSDTTIDL